MPIADDIRDYADAHLPPEAARLLGKMENGAADVASQLGKAWTAAEPFLAQLKDVGSAAAERADAVLAELRKDPRVARVYGTVESVAGTLLETVNDRLVAPARARAGNPSAAAPGAETSAPAEQTPGAPTSATTPKKAPASRRRTQATPRPAAAGEGSKATRRRPRTPEDTA